MEMAIEMFREQQSPARHSAHILPGFWVSSVSQNLKTDWQLRHVSGDPDGPRTREYLKSRGVFEQKRGLGGSHIIDARKWSSEKRE